MNRWTGLAALLTAEAMDVLDTTIVQVAGPAIHSDLGGATSDIKWFGAAYMLPFALLLITGGRLGDLVGRKRTFRIGVTVFLLASLACALAPSAGLLIGLRAVQGAAAALTIPQTIGLVKAMFEGKELSKALGCIGPVMGLSAVCGPILGGVITHELSWRAAFLVNVPLCLVVLVLSRGLVEDRAPRMKLAGLFGVEPGLFRRRGFPAALVTSTLFFGVTTGLMLVFTLHLQLDLGYDALRAGLGLLPWSAGLGVASWVSGAYLVPRFGHKVMYGGLAVLLIGVVLQQGAVIGVGAGLFSPAFFTAALKPVRPQEIGSAAGLLNAVQQLGGTIGVAVLGEIYFEAGPRAAFLAAAGAVVIAISSSPRPARAPRRTAQDPPAAPQERSPAA